MPEATELEGHAYYRALSPSHGYAIAYRIEHEVNHAVGVGIDKRLIDIAQEGVDAAVEDARVEEAQGWCKTLGIKKPGDAVRLRAPAAEWSDKRPSEPGWYWVRVRWHGRDWPDEPTEVTRGRKTGQLLCHGRFITADYHRDALWLRIPAPPAPPTERKESGDA